MSFSSEQKNEIIKKDRYPFKNGENKKDSKLSSLKKWRHRDLNPGHCGYEPHALAN